MEQNKENAVFNENKKLYIFLDLLIALTIIMFIIMWFSLNDKIEQINDTIEIYTSVFNDNTQVTEEPKIYMIKEYNGKIGVYIDNDFQYEVEIYVHALPEEDKKLLSKGICTTSEQELFKIISSYY